jgi:hypothetical protein
MISELFSKVSAKETPHISRHDIPLCTSHEINFVLQAGVVMKTLSLALYCHDKPSFSSL